MKLQGLKEMGVLGWALLLSAVFHVILILSVNFEVPDLKYLQDKIPPLEVVLVNAKTESKPKKADALAQANLDRGGNTDLDRQMKTALPPPRKKKTEVAQAEAAEAAAASRPGQERQEQAQQDKVAELERQAQELMTQLNAQKKLESAPAQSAAASMPDNGQQQEAPKNLNARDLIASSLDIARLEAQIAKQQEEYQKRPKRKELGGRTQEYRFATYVEAWRQKVEKIGNLNYPEAAKEQKLYGKLQLSVDIRADGSIDKIQVTRSSGHKILDDAAKRIVELAAPYAAFPEDIRKEYDIIGITRTWIFTKEDSFSTQ
ncbi:energy transducer TonB [Methylobacillus flagellatus]|uniref:TonB-like protein n=1 Tax=Methylobacillus flagellatus (strain ATCC 51484 / DSM 6875 / VKM B-1610 / KT) TaxID=265072 RepID=Q1GYB5_METFK|nr:energy transducer TonB [Methylobacillus flagellatus]ABE50772.1 TonB-like protein [Methylobacillus flagellatus KT]